MDRQAPSVIVPALIGGAICGTLSAVPLVNLLNCACCALILGAGFIGAFFQSRACRDAGVEFRAGNGALVGALAGFFYAVFNGIVGGLIALVSTASPIDEIIEAMEQAQGQGMPPEIADGIISALESGGLGLILLVGFGFSLLFGLVFGTLGGILGGAVFKVEPAPAAPTAPPGPIV